MPLFRKVKPTNDVANATTTLVMREIFSDAMPDGIEGDLQTLKDRLIAAEKVHPLEVLSPEGKHRQLDRCRLAPKTSVGLYNKHCYGLFEKETGALRTVVYVNLVHAADTANGKVLDANLPGNIRATLGDANALIEKPDTAIFYSISSINAGRNKPSATPTHVERPAALNPKQVKKAAAELAKAIAKGAKGAPQWHIAVNEGSPLTPDQLSDGEQLIRAVAEHLAGYGIKAFSTLSPMRSGTDPEKVTGFATWLKSQLSGEDVKILTASEQAFLQAAAQGENYFERISSLHKNYATLQGETKKTFEMLMEDLGTHYIAYARNTVKSDQPLDQVTRFHIGNGAKLAKIHYLPSDQTTVLDDAGAFGMMVNYRYEPEILSKRKEIARREDTVPLTPAVTQRYTARLEELDMPFKLGKRSETPTYRVPTDAPENDGNTLRIPSSHRTAPPAISWGERVSTDHVTSDQHRG